MRFQTRISCSSVLSIMPFRSGSRMSPYPVLYIDLPIDFSLGYASCPDYHKLFTILFKCCASRHRIRTHAILPTCGIMMSLITEPPSPTNLMVFPFNQSALIWMPFRRSDLRSSHQTLVLCVRLLIWGVPAKKSPLVITLNRK